MQSKALIVAALPLIGFAGSARAQTVFPVPAEDTLFNRVTMPAECVTAVGRVSVAYWRDRRLDTLRRAAIDSVPAPILTAAKRCRDHLAPNGVVVEPEWMFQLHALMGNVDSAWTYLGRWRSRIAGGDVRQQGEALTRIAMPALAGMQPTHWPSVERLARIIEDSVPVDTSIAALRALQHVVGVAIANDDTARVRTSANHFLELAANLPPEVRRHEWVRHFVMVVGLKMAEIVSWQELGSTPVAEWPSRLRARVKASLGDEGVRRLEETLLFGKPAPSIAGGVWFTGRDTTPHTAPPVSMPLKGKVSMVVFADPVGCPVEECSAVYTILERIRREFGSSIDIIVVARTYGWLGNKLLTDTVKVASAVRRDMLDTNRLNLPVILNVQAMRARRRPDPDRRLVYIPNPTVLDFKVPRLINGPPLTLVNHQGIIAAQYELGTDAEDILVRILRTLVNQARETASSADAVVR